MKTQKTLLVMAVLLIAMVSTVWAGGSKDNAAAAGGALPIKMTVRLFDQVPDMNNAYWKAYQEKAGVKLDVTWVPDGDYRTKLNLILTSNDLPEVLVANNSNDLNNPGFITAVQNGAFWDLTDVLGDFSKYPNLKNNVAPDSWRTSRVLGRIYGVPQSVPRVQGAPIIRKDLVDKAGLKMPTTMDELLDVLEAIVKQNPNMIGIASKQDMFINANGGLSAAFDNVRIYKNAEGGIVHPKLAPAFTDFIVWLNKAYKRGLLSKEFAVMKPTQATELFQSGAAVLFINESARWCYPFTQLLKQAGIPNAEAQLIPPLEGKPGFYSTAGGTGVVDSMFISKKVPEAKMRQILDYFERTTTQEYYEITTYGFEGVHFNKDAGGYRVATPQRDKDMGSSAPWQVLPLTYYPYMKLDSTAAPEAYNIAERKIFDDYGYEKKAITDTFSLLTSAKWVQVWPRYEQTWAANCAKAVVGDITIAEFQAYVDSINNNADVKAAYQEFAKMYQDMGL
ncbi:putative ABC transporter peptide-binding protein YtcQ [Spirochaetia bacterium]|nr:putative ABC transporter peptide-binding protein YtcQ [Spirochaetia bacterium]